MKKLALVLMALVGVASGHAAGTVFAQAGGTPYAAATISQPAGGWATDGTQGNPVLDASYHRDGVDPDPNNPTNITKAQVAYGQISYNSKDSASAGDGRQVLHGTLHNVPAGADYRWRVNVTVRHDHLARAINAPGTPSNGTWYSAVAIGTVNASFEILDANKNPLSPPRAVTGSDNQSAQRTTGQSGDDTVNGATYTFDHVLQVAAGDNKAKLVLLVGASVQLNARRPEVDVGGNSLMTIPPGGYIRAYDYGDPSIPMLKKADGTDAEWALE